MRELMTGSKVWLRSDLVDGERYGMETWNKNKMKGNIVTIESVFYSDVGLFGFIINEDGGFWSYTYEMIDWDKTDSITTDIDPNIIKYKEIFDGLLEVGFTRDEALKIMLNAGNVGKNA